MHFGTMAVPTNHMRIHSSHFAFTLAFVAIATVGLLATGCTTAEEQHLNATGELVGGDGRTPIAGARIDRYQLAFTVNSDGGGDVDIIRVFTRNESGNPIETNADGWFHISASNLALSYNWDSDEYVCDDVCVTWETVCNDVSEEVCDTCTDDDCHDECHQECTTECWDEEVCDDTGCWIETVCEDTCDDVCETVCEPVQYDCNCRWETYEECSDECTESTEECDWVTETHTSDALLREVTKSRATIWTSDADGKRRIITGVPDELETGWECSRDSDCIGGVWMQKDRFVLLPNSQ